MIKNKKKGEKEPQLNEVTHAPQAAKLLRTKKKKKSIDVSYETKLRIE